MSDEDRRDPTISPLWADLAGLPPALFTVGTLDPFLNDSLFMAARWQMAGSEATVDVYPERPTASPVGPPAWRRVITAIIAHLTMAS